MRLPYAAMSPRVVPFLDPRHQEEEQGVRELCAAFAVRGTILVLRAVVTSLRKLQSITTGLFKTTSPSEYEASVSFGVCGRHVLMMPARAATSTHVSQILLLS